MGSHLPILKWNKAVAIKTTQVKRLINGREEKKRKKIERNNWGYVKFLMTALSGLFIKLIE